jgi:RNase P/RNase MRP subunit p30
METINNLVKELKVGTRAELFRSSLRTLRWMVNKKKQKCEIVAISPDGKYFEPEFEFLAEV